MNILRLRVYTYKAWFKKWWVFFTQRNISTSTIPKKSHFRQAEPFSKFETQWVRLPLESFGIFMSCEEHVGFRLHVDLSGKANTQGEQHSGKNKTAHLHILCNMHGLVFTKDSLKVSLWNMELGLGNKKCTASETPASWSLGFSGRLVVPETNSEGDLAPLGSITNLQERGRLSPWYQ